MGLYSIRVELNVVIIENNNQTHDMSYSVNQPKKYDAVLGNKDINTSAAVLGGIEGVKQRLLVPEVSHRLAALNEALEYGREGISILFKALTNTNRFIRVRAYEILERIEVPDIKIQLERFREERYLIRFDGVYQCEKSNRYSYIRFYPDYTITATSSADTPQQLVTWFHKENCDLHNDIYIIEQKNRIVRFSSFYFTSGIDEFVARINIQNNTISLEWYSYKDSCTIIKEYNFVQIASMAPERHKYLNI